MATRGMTRVTRSGLSILGIIVVFIVLWEGYKLVWTAMEWTWPVRPDNRTMPHTWDIVATLFQPAQRNGPPLLLWVELKAALLTLREALVGFLIGGVVGFGLGVLFVRSSHGRAGVHALRGGLPDGPDHRHCPHGRGVGRAV